MKKFVLIALVVLPMLPMVALAQPITDFGTPTLPTNLTSVQGVFNLFRTIIGFFIVVFWILAAFFILYAAFLYLTAAGDEEKITKAGKVLKYAIIAVVVALLATVLPNLIASLLGLTAVPT